LRIWLLFTSCELVGYQTETRATDSAPSYVWSLCEGLINSSFFLEIEFPPPSAILFLRLAIVW
jgi:hypothetical protein